MMQMLQQQKQQMMLQGQTFQPHKPKVQRDNQDFKEFCRMNFENFEGNHDPRETR